VRDGSVELGRIIEIQNSGKPGGERRGAFSSDKDQTHASMLALEHSTCRTEKMMVAGDAGGEGAE